jgi:hypothetical protein
MRIVKGFDLFLFIDGSCPNSIHANILKKIEMKRTEIYSYLEPGYVLPE